MDPKELCIIRIDGSNVLLMIRKMSSRRTILKVLSITARLWQAFKAGVQPKNANQPGRKPESCLLPFRADDKMLDYDNPSG